MSGARVSRPGAHSSAGERPLHTREVRGSIPRAPTFFVSASGDAAGHQVLVQSGCKGARQTGSAGQVRQPHRSHRSSGFADAAKSRSLGVSRHQSTCRGGSARRRSPSRTPRYRSGGPAAGASHSASTRGIPRRLCRGSSSGVLQRCKQASSSHPPSTAKFGINALSHRRKVQRASVAVPW
jgi:hypothetical protein